MEQPKKRRFNSDDLVLLRRGPQVSQSALAHILKHVRDHGPPEVGTSRRNQYRERKKTIAVGTPYGTVLQNMELTLASGEPATTAVVHPFALLHRTVTECRPFLQLLRSRLRRYPCSVARPWHLIIYFDEVTPTDPCSTKVDRHKVQAFYWSFMELADPAFVDAMWFVGACATSVQVAELQGSMGEFVKIALRTFFFNSDDHNFGTSGCKLDIWEEPAEPTWLYATHTHTLADFAALCQLLGSLGQMALKPCPSCTNIVKDDLADGVNLHPLSSLEPNKWEAHTDRSVRQIHTYLQERKGLLGKTAYEELEKRMGFHCRQNSMVQDEGMTTVSSLRYDPAHTFLLGGIFTKEIAAFLDMARARTRATTLVTTDDFGRYLRSWKFPKCHSSCQSAFDRSDKMRASMSEQLSLAPVLALFFEDIVLAEPEMSRLHEAARSAILCCDVTEMMLHASWVRPHPSQMQNAYIDYSKKHKEVHGTEYWTLKNHLPFHLCEQYGKDRGNLPNCLCGERRHKTPKRFARESIRLSGQTTAFNTSLMEELICQHFYDWRHFGKCEESRVLTRKERHMFNDAFPMANTILMSRSYKSEQGVSYRAGDAALLGAEYAHACGVLWYLLEIDDEVIACVEVWPVLASRGRCSRHRIESDAKAVPVSALKAIVCYRKFQEYADVLIPMQYRTNEMMG